MRRDFLASDSTQRRADQSQGRAAGGDGGRVRSNKRQHADGEKDTHMEDVQTDVQSQAQPSAPLSGRRCVMMLIMRLACFEVDPTVEVGEPDACGLAEVFTDVVKRLWGHLIVAEDKEPVHTLKARWETAGLAWELKAAASGAELDYAHIAKTSLDGVMEVLSKKGRTIQSYGQLGVYAVVVPEGHSHEEWITDCREISEGVIHSFNKPERMQILCLALMCKAWRGKLPEDHRKGVPQFTDFRVGEDLEIHSP